ncbi:MAG: hypothetical protein RIG66_01435 [Coleofasciculus sp. E2-BRE-01]
MTIPTVNFNCPHLLIAVIALRKRIYLSRGLGSRKTHAVICDERDGIHECLFGLRPLLLTPEHLAIMPSEWIIQLHQAASSLV